MGNILEPNTPEENLERARQRRVPTIGNANSSTTPASPALPVEPSVPVEPSIPVVDEAQQQPLPVEEEPQVDVPPITTEPLSEPPAPSPPLFSEGLQVEPERQQAPGGFGDILTPSTLEPIYDRSEQTQRKAQPQEIIEATQSIQVPNLTFAKVPKTDRNLVMSRVQALKEANANLVRQNRGGLQDFTVRPGGGERMFSTSAIDNALASTGLGSIIGTRLQDRLDPGFKNDEANILLSWLGSAGQVLRQAKGLAQGVVGWLATNPIAGVTGADLKPLEDWEQQGWKEAGEALKSFDNTTPETSGGQLTLETYGTVFDPVKGYWGDAGKHPVLSPLIYLLNLPENILMGMVYDTADALGFDKSNSWDNRTRTLGALAGRDWGVSNRWSEERYISLQEPVGQVAGQRTGNPYWDLPENISRTLGQPEGEGVGKNLHIVLQTVPAMIGEVITGGVADFGVGELLSLTPKARTILRGKDGTYPDVVDNVGTVDLGGMPGVRLGGDPDVPKPDLPQPHTPVVTDDTVKVTTPNAESITGDPVTVEVPLAPKTPEVIIPPDGQVIDYTDIPSGRRVSDEVVSGIIKPDPERIPGSADLVRRPLSDYEATRIARRQGLVEPDFKRTLSENELAELNRRYGRLFDNQTTMSPTFPYATHITLPDGSVRTLAELLSTGRSRTVIDDILPTPDDLVNIRRELDDLSKQYMVSLDEDKFKKLQELHRKHSEAMFRHASEPVESAYTTRILEGTLPSTQESFSSTAHIVGTDMVAVERTLESHRVVIDQLTEELDEIKTIRNQVQETIPTIKPVGRQDIEDALGTYQEFSDDVVPELGFREQQTPADDDWVVSGKPPTKFAEENSDMTLWFHGTSSDVPIQQVNLLNGATPSEYGLGVYLTKNDKVAEQAALALPQINRPPRPDSVDTTPVRLTISTTQLTRVFDLDAPMPKDIDALFYNTTVSVFGQNVADDAFRQATTNLKLRKAWDAVRESVYNVAGSPASEKQIREFQQSILDGFKKLDVQAGLLKDGDNPVMVVYNPKLLTPVSAPDKLPAPPFIKQYEARSWLDKLTRNTEPTNPNIHNSIQSNLDYAEQATREAAESLAVELDKQKKLIEEYIIQKDKLETVVRKEKLETVKQLEATGDTKEAVVSIIRNDLATEAKVRRQRSKTSEPVKDYTKPKSKRGKKPPVVETKPVQVVDLAPTTPTRQVDDAVAEQLSDEVDDLWKQYESATSNAEKTRILKELEDKSDELIRGTGEPEPTDETPLGVSKQPDLSETVKDTPKPEPVPVEVIPADVEPMKVGVPLEGKRKGLGDRIREQADKIKEASKQEVEALTKILDNAGKISQNYEKLVDEVVEMVNEDLDKAAKMEATPKVSGVKVPDFTVRQGTQARDIKDWKSAGVEGFHSFGDKTDFLKKYPKADNYLDDLVGVKADRNYIENTYQNQRNYQNILNGKNPMFDEAPFSEWVPSTGKLEGYTNWTDYAKKYSPKKYEHTAPEPPASKGGVSSFNGDFVDLGSSKRFDQRQEDFLTKHTGATFADGTPVPLETLENTHWNLEGFKRVKEGKNPIGSNEYSAPYTEWVPSTGELLAYKNWDDYADQYSVSKYTVPKKGVVPKATVRKADQVVEDLLTDWDNLDLDDVRNADQQAKLFTKPELDNPCL